jgi:hypothetical protein
MSAVAFFMNKTDTVEFVTWLISKFGLKFVDEWAYELPLPVRDDPGDVVGKIFGPGHHRRFALIHPEWSLYPLLTSHVEPRDGSKPFHALSQRYGGPSFDFTASRVDTTEDGVPFIVLGRLDDYPSYYVEKGSPEALARPEQMVAIWKQIQSYIRKNGLRTICRERQSVGPYALRHALTEYERRTWLRCGSDHYDPRPPRKA